MRKRLAKGEGLGAGHVRIPLALGAVAVLLFSLAFLVKPVAAQVLFGSVVGNVIDATGAAVAGATVKITETSTNETRSVVTNEGGAYTISTVPAGTYQVEINRQGFRSFLTSNILVNQNNVVRVDAQLQVGAQAEKIEVTAEAAVLQTDRADIHTEVATQQLETLPQATRSYQGLLETVPGMVVATGQLAGGTNNPSKSIQYSFNGTGTQAAEVRVEGVSTNNPWQYYNQSYVPSMEAVQNVNVATNATDSEQSMSGGASVNVMLKSGTNQFHATLFEYNINSKFEANSFFAAAGTKPPPLNDNQVGGNFGGYIIKNKLFFFGNYEGDLDNGSNAGIISFPNQTMLSGNESGSATPMYDPSTGAANGTGRTAFPGNIIPTSRINPITAKIAALVPPTNLPGSLNDMYLSETALYNLHKADTKYDFNPNSKLHISGRWGTEPYNSIFGPVYGPVLGGASPFSACGACNFQQHGETYMYSASAAYVASPTFVIDTNFGEINVHQLLYPTQTNVAYGSQVLGIPGTNTGPLPWAGGVPNFAISSYVTMGYSYPALDYIQPSYEYNANASKIKGSHTIRFGFDMFKHDLNHIEISPTAFTFTGGLTTLNGGPSSNQYNSVADFLLGLPQSEANYTQVTQPYLTLRTWDFALYARDSWQASKKITINYGLRWEYYPVPMQANGRGINLYNPVTNIIQECGVGGISSTCGIQVSKRLFSPSLGIAYRAAQNLVIRAGFAMNPLQDDMARAGMKSFPAEVGAIFTGANSYTAYNNISQGVPIVTVPAATNGLIQVPAGTGSLFTDPPVYTRGTVMSWNFTVQREFAGGWTAQAGYVGTHAYHEYSGVNINYGLLNGGAASQPLNQFGITASTTEVMPWNSDIYHALQTQLRKQLSRGLTMQASYTFSKDITFQPGGPAGAGLTSATILIPQYLNYDRYLSSLDRTNTFVWSASYDLPFGKGKQMLQHGVPAAITGGWSLGGIFTHYSGVPFSVTSSSTSCNCPGNTTPANLVGPVTKVGNGLNGTSYFNPSAFSAVTTAAIGTEGFDELRGPGPTNLDMNLSRDFRITERVHFLARAESFNITNHPHFGNPGSNVSTPSSFMQITSTTPLGRLIDPRYFRFGFKIMF